MTLGKLVCGESDHTGHAKSTLDHLTVSIDRFAAKSIAFLGGDFGEDTQIFGAFSARVVLENSFAGLVGRLDPFRLLYLREFQSQSDYDYGKAANSGFRWTGDVLSQDNPLPKMWSVDHKNDKISRALFSQFSDHLFWAPAFNMALDSINSLENQPAVLDGIRQLEADVFINSVKGRCASLYSTLSKGVHWEFFVSSLVMDEDTVKDNIRDCLSLISDLALVSHFIPVAYHSLRPVDAISTYVNFRNTLS